MFNLEFLHRIRSEEIDELVGLIPQDSRVLEFGAGTGEQAKMLTERGFDVVAIDLRSSNYKADRLFPVVDYDGRHIPLDDHSVDVIFSSSVLEHVDDLPTIFAEFRRVLKPGGFGLHAMPTPAWRFWTFVSGIPTAGKAIVDMVRHLLKPPPGFTRRRAVRQDAATVFNALMPAGHGTSREGISELWTFSPRTWRKRFAAGGLEVFDDRPMELFYTGHIALGGKLSFHARRWLAPILGSACHLYFVRANPEHHHE